jgi:hypothetical protein
MFQQACSIEVVILRTVSDCATDFNTRKRTIVCVLPAHRERRQVPVVTAGNSGTIRIRFLMAAGAIQTRHALAFRTTHDIRDVATSFVTLLWIVGRGVTVDAARTG